MALETELMNEVILYAVYFKSKSEREWSRAPGQKNWEDARDLAKYYGEEGYNTYIMEGFGAFGEGNYE